MGEGYEILRRANLLTAEYELREELVTPHLVFAKDGRAALMQAITKLVNTDDLVRVATYTCGGYVFLIGCRADCVFLVDTHSIGPEIGGCGNAILKAYPANDPATTYQLSTWIWQRLHHSGDNVKAMQSFVVVQNPRCVSMFSQQCKWAWTWWGENLHSLVLNYDMMHITYFITARLGNLFSFLDYQTQYFYQTIRLFVWLSHASHTCLLNV